MGSEPRQNLVHLTDDVHLDASWRVDCDGTVMALALDGDTLWVGGDFNSVGGNPARALAAVEVRTGSVRSLPAHPDGSVLALLVRNGSVYLGDSSR